MANIYDELRSTLRDRGAPECLETLIQRLEAEGQLPQLFEALLLRKRWELGLPVEGTDSIRDIPEEHQQAVEDYYVEVCRKVGGLFLAKGDIAGAWPYFRAIDEPASVAQAIEAWQAPEEPEYNDDGVSEVDQIVDIAFQQGAHPKLGYRLILDHYGVCRAITTFEHQFPHQGEVREHCGQILVRHLYDELRANVRADIVERIRAGEAGGETEDPREDATLAELISKRPWLFEQMGYHVDVSHLQSCVRVASSLEDRESIRRGVEMCEYGRQLARDFQIQERPPFDDFYNDYRILLRAIGDEGVDGAIRYFTTKIERHQGDEDGGAFCAEVLVHLLHRIGRSEQAISVYRQYLENSREPQALAPSLLRLCEGARDFRALAEVSEQRGDVLNYALALIKAEQMGAPLDAAESAG